MAFCLSNSLSLLRVDQNLWQNAKSTASFCVSCKDKPSGTYILPLHSHLHHYIEVALRKAPKDTTNFLCFHSKPNSVKQS